MKKFQCILCCFLCLTLLVFVGLRPVRASADSLVQVATSYGDVASVAPELVPFIVILIGLDWYYSNIDEIVAKAQELYDSASSSVQSWADNVRAQIIDGTSAFKIPTAVKNEVEQKTQKKLPPDLPYVIIPPDLLSIDLLSQDDVFAQDITGALEQGNKIAEESYSLLGSIRAFLGYSFDGITSSIKTVTDTLSSKFDYVSNFLGVLNDNMKTEIIQARDILASINGAIKTEIIQAREILATINDNMKTEIIQVREVLATINTNMKSELQQLKDLSASINSNMQRKFNEISSSITGSITSFSSSVSSWLRDIKDAIVALPDQIGIKIQSAIDSITVAGGSGGDFDDDDKQSIDNIVTGGIDHGLGYFGSSGDILQKYSSGFLVAGMIFGKFAEISFFNDLLIVSLSIGLVGAFLGIALNISSSDAKSSKANKSKAGGS